MFIVCRIDTEWTPANSALVLGGGVSLWRSCDEHVTDHDADQSLREIHCYECKSRTVVVVVVWKVAAQRVRPSRELFLLRWRCSYKSAEIGSNF